MTQARRIIGPFIITCGLLILILDSRSAIAGAQEGIQLCIRTLIPSLFPFFVVCGYFCQIFSKHRLPFLTPILRLCRIPDGAASIFVIGMLGGYPVGAKAIADSHKKGQLQLKDAQRMLGFCNNAGPAFVFGIIGGLFHNKIIPWILMLILMLSAIITGWLLPGQINSHVQTGLQSASFKEIFDSSIKAIASVCGWVILFRVVLTLSKRWFLWLLPDILQTVITGILELSNGCFALGNISNDGLRFILGAGILSFGGLCVFLQTMSVIGSMGLGLYFPGKIMQCLISLILSGIAQFYIFSERNRMQLEVITVPLLLVLIYIAATKLSYAKKVVAFTGQLMYNTDKKV